MICIYVHLYFYGGLAVTWPINELHSYTWGKWKTHSDEVNNKGWCTGEDYFDVFQFLRKSSKLSITSQLVLLITNLNTIFKLVVKKPNIFLWMPLKQCSNKTVLYTEQQQICAALTSLILSADLGKHLMRKDAFFCVYGHFHNTCSFLFGRRNCSVVIVCI